MHQPWITITSVVDGELPIPIARQSHINNEKKTIRLGNIYWLVVYLALWKNMKVSCDYCSQHIWANYNISLTWIKAIWGWFPYKNHDFQWARSELVIIYPEHMEKNMFETTNQHGGHGAIISKRGYTLWLWLT